MSKSSTLYLHTKHKIDRVDPRIFGGLLEHMGRAVYDGVVDLDTAKPRQDVLDALKSLDLTVIRYPGGNFVSGYNWRDGIGPVENRPKMRELAWRSIETNKFGTDEFMALCKDMNWSPMLAVNLGTGSAREACDLLEYCNAPVGTRFGDMRAENGQASPYDVKLWCLGNEMDGPWQQGHVPAEQYAFRAQQAGHLMRLSDPSIELVAAGSSHNKMPHYIDWDRKVLEYVGDYADYLSLHRYVNNHEDDTPRFLAVTNTLDQQIEEVNGLCLSVAAKRRSRKRTYLCFDEWNVWYKDTEVPESGFWKEAPPLIEEVYNLEDALVAAGFLHSFVRHADSVKVANIAQIVNVIAPILTQGDDVLIQSIFWPFEMFSSRRDGVSLRPVVEGDAYEAKDYGTTNYIDASAILGDGVVHVFATNRDLEQKHELKIDLADANLSSLVSGEIMSGGTDPKVANSFDSPGSISKQSFEQVDLKDGRAVVELPPLSFVALTFKIN